MTSSPLRSRLLLSSLVLALGVTAGCASTEPDPMPRTTQPTDLPEQPTPTEAPGSESTSGASSGRPEVVDTLVEDLEVPWGADFLPDGTAVVTERISGRVLGIDEGGEVTTLGTIADAAPQGEAGLLGVAVSPDFDSDRTLFLYLTTATDNRVVKARLDGTRLSSPTVVLDGIPAGFIHDGGRIAFGPDGHLYVTTGETGDPDLAQDPESLAGKILRITPDGDPAPGNPDPDSPVWSLGHRNVQGLAWDDEGRLWASEFGDSEWDELNLVEKGGNYGWPRIEGAGDDPDYVDPQVVWPVDQASPSGLAFADGHLWMAGLRGQRLWRIAVSEDGEAAKPRAFLTEEFGRLRTVAAAPDGLLWVTTSNRDGRGQPTPADDRIVRVRP
ncbi:sorbosone dehydrogenase family protein [Nocardioides sp. zg-1228]|uniref:PQQ-dependent sugar dehydrogenase n=1 Tax=Nocardioides sp. zg-1228 TaxID=2763008 RepID=UPI0016434CD2|nr:PQQ-dependent sugar dehydrogenase [Nocardioides sp. zg-1228]MBC2933256.1 PQQ-dependent sugar dehydrogenase [Nocardioides sp. zg-1228]QSF56577.1 PQQ-dependent sugar dehydrogenase [Nocardioides sp. zg-1228]